MATRDPTRLIGHIMDFLRDHPHGGAIWACACGAINDSLSPSNPEIAVDFSGADHYLALFAGALGFAVFPHTRRPARAEALGIMTRSDAWHWATKQV